MRNLLRAALAAVVLACCPSPASAQLLKPARPLQGAAISTLVERCRSGDAGGAVDEFATWDAARVAAEASPRPDADNATLATLVVLHTGAAIQRGTFGGVSVPPQPDPAHFPAALRLVGVLVGRSRSDPRLRAFCSTWYILAASLWSAGRQYVAAEQTLRSGRSAFGDDAEFFLAAGSVAESLMGPYASYYDAMAAHGTTRMNSGDTRTTAAGLLTPEYADAESRLERALSLNPGLVEARLRLGHVYFLLDRPADARQEFERVLKDAPRANHPFAAYLAALFLGQVHQRAKRLDEARTAFELATATRPADPAAHLALGHLLVESGRADEGWAVVRRWLADPGSQDDSPANALDHYRSGQYWQAAGRLEALGAWVRR